MDSAQLNPQELRFLQEAVDYLEHPSFLMRVANLLGRPVEGLLNTLPQRLQKSIHDASHEALNRGMQWAIRSLPTPDKPHGTTTPTHHLSSALTAAEPAPDAATASRSRWSLSRLNNPTFDRHRHTALAALTGAGGGLFGLAGLPVEIPATTVVMLRSIASIAAENGEDLDDPAVRLNCLSVFSYGSEPLDRMESSYLTSRIGMALVMQQASQQLATHGSREMIEMLARGTTPVLSKLISRIASRFQIVVTEKAAAQATPILGAATGALVNAAFTDHFNRVARYHFGILQLERKYGETTVQGIYRELQTRSAEPPVAISRSGK